MPAAKDLPPPPSRTTAGFAFSYIERCINESFARRRFGKSEMSQVLEHLSQGRVECAYCGSPEVRRWDHLFPVASGGDTVLGNMVPACARCDDSKRDIPYRQWMLSYAQFSPKSQRVPDLDLRLSALDKYVADFS